MFYFPYFIKFHGNLTHVSLENVYLFILSRTTMIRAICGKVVISCSSTYRPAIVLARHEVLLNQDSFFVRGISSSKTGFNRQTASSTSDKHSRDGQASSLKPTLRKNQAGKTHGSFAKSTDHLDPSVSRHVPYTTVSASKEKTHGRVEDSLLEQRLQEVASNMNVIVNVHRNTGVIPLEDQDEVHHQEYMKTERSSRSGGSMNHRSGLHASGRKSKSSSRNSESQLEEHLVSRNPYQMPPSVKSSGNNE